MHGVLHGFGISGGVCGTICMKRSDGGRGGRLVLCIVAALVVIIWGDAIYIAGLWYRCWGAVARCVA